MITQSSASDPRSIVTPDAFEVSVELLGLPLASPSRRLMAMTIDLAVIGVITMLTSSFALVLGVVAAIFFVRAGFKRTPVRGSVFGRAMRLSVGCLGLIIGITTAVIWTALDFGKDGDGEDVTEQTGGSIRVRAGELIGGLRAFDELRRAEDEEAAELAARGLARRLRQINTPDPEIRALLLELAPKAAPWSDEAPLIVDRAMADDEDGLRPSPSPDEDIEAMSTEEVLEAYMNLLGDEGEVDGVRRSALRSRLARELAADTLRLLEEEVADLRAALGSQRAAVEELSDRLADDRGGSIFSWLRGFIDELGFGFGWASLYLTVMLSWWKGQTLGKKLLGIRVVRLDGEAITWWTAFERAGGYAAGFATGLLGFAQVYWDANRQAIHDRIVGTVVLVDGAPKVGSWEEAL